MIINTYKTDNIYWRNFKEMRNNKNGKFIGVKKTLQKFSVLILHFDSFRSHQNDKEEKDAYKFN